MYVSIQIHYIANSKLLQESSFPLKGRNPEKVALDFWKQIRKDMSYRAVLEKVILNGEQDITESVKELEKQELRKMYYESEELPF
jgi:hypothetical protein